MGGKTSTSTSTVQVPSDVLARYNSVNANAEQAASTPFQSYSSDPSAFVAPLTGTQQAGIQNTNNATGQAQPYYQAATGNLLNAQSTGQDLYGQSNQAAINSTQQGAPILSEAYGLANAGAAPVNAQQIGASQINQFMNPYLSSVVGSESALLNQNNQQAMAGQLGNAITSGAFGGDRAGIAAANLNQQQNLANANIYSGLLNTGFNTALGAAQQQQGVNLGAEQANRAAVQNSSAGLANISQDAYAQNMGAAQQLAANAQGEYNIGSGTANSLAGLGAGSQSAALQGATAQLTAGQQEQSTQQAGLTSLYNQFLQQQAYPFQTAQFLANVAEGTGSLSGSTTSTTQPTGLFGNLLSDRRAKEDIKEIGKAKNGLKIYSFRYKGDPEKVTHIGFMADEVEKKHPEAVGLAGGLKTVDYERASRADGGGLMFDPNAGEYGLGAASMPGHSTYVPAPTQGAARHIAFQHSPTPPQQQGLGALANDVSQAKNLYSDGSSLWNDGKNLVSGMTNGQYARGGLAVKRDYGGPVDDPFQSDTDLQRRERGLAVGENAIEHAPNSANSGPVSGALSSQATSPKYNLGATPQASNSNNSGGLGQLAALASLGKDIAPYALEALALASGGLVPREHHADGDSVGDDDPNSPENQEIRKAYPSANYNDPPASPAGLMPTSARSEAAARTADGVAGANATRPIVSPDDAAKLPDLDPSKLDNVPTPPARPKDLNAPDAVPTPEPGLSPKPRYLPPAVRTMNANIAPSMPSTPSAGLAGYDPQATSSFLIGKESGGKYNAVNPASSAYGLGQFTGSTAQTVVARHPDLPPLSDFYSKDPNVSVPAQQAYISAHAQDQAKVLTANGIDPTPQNIHVNWFLGEKGGPAFLKAMQQNPNAPGYALAQPDQVAANKTIFYNRDGTPRTAAEVYAALNGGPTRNADLGSASAPSAAAPQSQPQQGGLMGSLSNFFHGQPDGQTSPNGGMGERALMAVLSGLGAVGSYKGQSPLGAILQGLGAGAHGWMDSGKQQADIANTQAHTGLVGAETGATNVNSARNSVIPEYGYVLGPDGKLHVVDKNIAGPGVPLMGGVPNAAKKPAGGLAPSSPATPAPTAATPSAPAAPAAPVAPSGPDLTGVGYDGDSAHKAKSEVLAGPQARHDLDQSAAYQAATRQASLQAQEASTYTRPLVTTLAQAYQTGGAGTPGAGFTGRAAMINTLNTTARMFGGGENFFGDADKGEVLANKINTLQGLMLAQGADERSLGAFNALKGANATLDQPPEASAEIAAHLLTDQMRAQDREKHAEKWKADSPTGTMLGAQDDFQTKNGPQKYDKETSQLSDLMLHQGKYVQQLNSGNYTPAQIANSLKKHGLDPALSRYFVRGQ